MLEYFPEPEERKIIVECGICEKPLFQGDTVYKFLHRWICEDCVNGAKETIESEVE